MEKIDKYIENINIEHWKLEQAPDFNKYGEKPV